jgi:tol-pal system protein YbgF
MWRPGNMARFGAAVLAAALVSPVYPASDQSIEERLDRIERQLEGRGLIDMLNQVEKLQSDVQQLRGDIEVQNHQLEDMQRRQRELYLDIDRRLQTLETGHAPAPAAATEMAPVPTTESPGVSAPPPSVAAPPVSVVPPPPPPARAPAAAPVNPAEEQAEYEKALAILREGRYTEAVMAFNQFLANHPDGAYSDNAYYWLGETYYVTRDFDRALATFSKLAESYPQSSKVAGAKLKIGYIYYEKQNWKEARQILNGLVAAYPGTTEARLAEDRLQRMKKEGH